MRFIRDLVLMGADSSLDLQIVATREEINSIVENLRQSETWRAGNYELLDHNCNGERVHVSIRVRVSMCR